MKKNPTWIIAVFMMMFGAYSLGRDIFEVWRGESSLLFPIRLLLSGISTLLCIVWMRAKDAAPDR